MPAVSVLKTDGCPFPRSLRGTAHSVGQTMLTVDLERSRPYRKQFIRHVRKDPNGPSAAKLAALLELICRARRQRD
eukprot:7801738-Alexandrium_andersonii.AAC.1